MTETTKRVEIGGKMVLSRNEAERAIRLADPEEVVSLAFCAAIGGEDGGAILDLETGDILARAGAFTPPLNPRAGERGEVYVVLHTVSAATRETVWYESHEASVRAGEHHVLRDEEVREVLERTRERMRAEGHDEREIAGADAQSISVEEAEEYLEGKGETYEDRLGHEFAYQLFNDLFMPTVSHFARLAREQLDAIYGESGVAEARFKNGEVGRRIGSVEAPKRPCK